MFEWKKEMELGITIIDEQHKRLIAIGNNVATLLSEYSEGDDLLSRIILVLEDLKHYTLYHFRTEEDFFIKYNYSDFISHKKEHDAFIYYLWSINISDIEKDRKTFLEDLLGRIFKWIYNHIIDKDYMYKDFLIQKDL